MTPAIPEMIPGLQKNDPHDVGPAEPDGAEDADLIGTLAHAAHHGHKHDERGAEKNDAGNAVGEMFELRQHLHAALDHLLDGHDLGSGKRLGDLLHHVLDRAVLAQGRHLRHGDAAGLIEHHLGGGKHGKGQLIVLGARGFQHPGNRETTVVHGQAIAGLEVENPRCLRSRSTPFSSAGRPGHAAGFQAAGGV